MLFLKAVSKITTFKNSEHINNVIGKHLRYGFDGGPKNLSISQLKMSQNELLDH